MVAVQKICAAEHTDKHIQEAKKWVNMQSKMKLNLRSNS